MPNTQGTNPPKIANRQNYEQTGVSDYPCRALKSLGHKEKRWKKQGIPWERQQNRNQIASQSLTVREPRPSP